MQDLIINYLKFEKGIYNYGKPVTEIICSRITEEAMDLSSWLRGNIKKTRKSDSVKRQEEVLVRFHNPLSPKTHAGYIRIYQF